MILFRNRVAFIFFTFFCRIAMADDIVRSPLPPIMYKNLIEPLLTEVTEITRMPVPQENPIVYVSTRESIEKVYCKDQTHECHVAAITDDETGEILLSPALLQINIFTASVIFHELVHWSQIKTKLFRNESDCTHWAKSEMHAYTAQNRFLVKHGVKGFEVPDLLAQCR